MNKFTQKEVENKLNKLFGLIEAEKAEELENENEELKISIANLSYEVDKSKDIVEILNSIISDLEDDVESNKKELHKYKIITNVLMKMLDVLISINEGGNKYDKM